MQSFQQFKIYGYLVCLPSLNVVVLTNWYQIWLLQILITAYYHLNSTNELSPFFNKYIKQKLTSGDRRARFFLVDDSGVAFSLNFLILSSNCDTMTAISLLYLNIFSTLLKHFTHTPSALECMDITSWIIFRFSSVTFNFNRNNFFTWTLPSLSISFTTNENPQRQHISVKLYTRLGVLGEETMAAAIF